MHAESELEGRPLGWASTALMPGTVFQLIGPPIVGLARKGPGSSVRGRWAKPLVQKPSPVFSHQVRGIRGCLSASSHGTNGQPGREGEPVRRTVQSGANAPVRAAL